VRARRPHCAGPSGCLAVLAFRGVSLKLAFGLYVSGVGVEGLASESAAAADRQF